MPKRLLRRRSRASARGHYAAGVRLLGELATVQTGAAPAPHKDNYPRWSWRSSVLRPGAPRPNRRGK
eukprot:3496109-Pyramimonas_sp.AAC.1